MSNTTAQDRPAASSLPDVDLAGLSLSDTQEGGTLDQETLAPRPGTSLHLSPRQFNSVNRRESILPMLNERTDHSTADERLVELSSAYDQLLHKHNEAVDAVEFLEADSQRIYNAGRAIEREKWKMEKDNTRLEDRAMNLHASLGELQLEYDEFKQDAAEKLALSVKLSSIGFGGLSSLRKDPDTFNGSVPSKLEDFLDEMFSKMYSNRDHYPTELDRKIYFRDQLGGHAKSLFNGYLVNGLPTGIATVEDMIAMLRVSYGDVIKETNQRTAYLGCRQYDDPLSIFLPAWQTAYQQSGSIDVPLAIHLLSKAIHPKLQTKLTFIDPDDLPRTVSGYLTVLRKQDALLRSTLGDNYTKSGAEKRPGSATTPAHGIHRPVTLNSAETEPVWVPAEGKRAKTDEEKAARRKYNKLHNLCIVCDSPDHEPDDCPNSYYNKRKAKEAAANGGGADKPKN